MNSLSYTNRVMIIINFNTRLSHNWDSDDCPITGIQKFMSNCIKVIKEIRSMKQTKIFFIIVVVGVFSMLLAPSLNAAPANAIGDNWSCKQTQSGKETDSCSGSSSKSPNKDVVNPGGHAPSGQNRR